MAKGDKNKNPGCWAIGIAVVVIAAIAGTYPWILILVAVLIAAAIGLSIWKKRKAKPNIKVTEYHLKGVFAREDDIFRNLMQVDPDYEATKKEWVDLGMTDCPIYKWTPRKLPLELLPEPENQYDPHAIKAVVDGIAIGYIPKEKPRKWRRSWIEAASPGLPTRSQVVTINRWTLTMILKKINIPIPSPPAAQR